MRDLKLMLFEHDVNKAQKALEYGVNYFLVDWENKGKEARQNGYDTEIRPGTSEDLRKLSSLAGAITWCRLNRFGSWTRDEVEMALDSGASGIFLPMVTSLYEVEHFLDFIKERCSAGILIETVEAANLSEKLSAMPLDSIYFGLNDYSISRKDDYLFRAVWDRTVEQVRNQINDDTHFGFGGVTAIGHGTPVPFISLMQEMARIKCSFSFLRRSFKRDIIGKDPTGVVTDIQRCWRELSHRTPAEIYNDHQQLLRILGPLCS